MKRTSLSPQHIVFFLLTVIGLSLTQQSALADSGGHRVGEINPNEKEKFKIRYETKNSSTFSLGPGFASNLNNSTTLYDLAVGYEWEAGSQGAVLVEANGAFGSSTTFLDGIIGGKYFFSEGDISPVIKGGFGLGASHGSGLDDTGGFMGMAGAGVTMFRTSTVHLEILASYYTIFKSNANGNPGLTSITLGLLY